MTCLFWAYTRDAAAAQLLHCNTTLYLSQVPMPCAPATTISQSLPNFPQGCVLLTLACCSLLARPRPFLSAATRATLLPFVEQRFLLRRVSCVALGTSGIGCFVFRVSVSGRDCRFGASFFTAFLVRLHQNDAAADDNNNDDDDIQRDYCHYTRQRETFKRAETKKCAFVLRPPSLIFTFIFY